MTNMMTWYEDSTGGNRSKNTPGAVFDRMTDDFDRRVIQYYRDSLDASYPTSSVAYTGAEDGFPAGDLNWFPDKLNDWLTDVDDNSIEVIPSEFTLSQNYPNPFNPSTIIKYAIPSKANVTLKVYDVLGSEVATIIKNKVQNTGKYEVKFDASRLSSGVYFYTLNAGNFLQTKKMILIK
ncbi:MAG: T9SS type A sorting domain-containing protein [Ignavibacteriae bacterium]|nr:T9SS type A sorting domain-containing protein [Ignavibacteriota bacterium]